MEHRFGSGGNLLAGHLARPPVRADVSQVPAVILAHGYPSDVHAAIQAAAALPELADRIAGEMGWLALVVGFRGCAGSEGSFSLAGWLEDLHSAVSHLRSTEAVSGVWIAGFGTGGALAICAAADNAAVEGIATLGAPADFDDWATHPRRLLEHARDVGMIEDPLFPPAWRRGAESSASSGRSPTPRGSLRARCSCSTAATTTSFPPSMPGCWSTPTAAPSSASSAVLGTACATTRGQWRCYSGGSTGSRTVGAEVTAAVEAAARAVASVRVSRRNTPLIRSITWSATSGGRKAR